jgi:hypothetical protein
MYEELKKLLENLSAETKKQVFDFVSSRSSNASAPGGEKVNLPASANAPAFQSRNDELRRRLIAAAERKLDGNDPRQKAGTFLFNPITHQIKRSPTSGGGSASYDLSGNPKETGPGSPDDLRTDRLSRMKEGSAGAAAEQARRQGIRDSVALPISDNVAFADSFKQRGLPTPGDKRDIFKDKEGRIEDPATLKARLIKEGMNPNDATLAAGQRYRDMFGRQADVVMGVAPERRMEVMQQLKDARKDNLQALTAARLNNPFRKEVGVTTKIEAPDGTVLAQRGEGEVRTDKAGNTVDSLGRMNFLNGAANLKDALTAYNNADVAKRPNVPLYYEGTNEPVVVDGKQQFTTAPAPTKSLVTANPDTNTLTPVAGDPNISSKKGVELSGQGIGTKVTGAYGTAVGGISGGTPLTQDQRLGLAPLPPETQKARDALVGGPTPPQGMEMKDGKLRAYEKDPIKEQLAKNQKDALDKAADEELKKRQTATRRS